MKRRIALALAISTVSLAALAAPGKDPKVERWLRRSMTQCPSPTWDFAAVDEPMPPNIRAYRMRETSESSTCRETVFALVTSSGQILAGQIVPLGSEPISPAARIKALFAERMKMDADVKVTETPLADGIREVIVSKKTSTGIVPIHAWLDPSQSLFVLGRRGQIDHDAGISLLEDIDADSGVEKGPDNAQIRIVELSDFQCPSCRRGHEIVAPLLAKYGNKIHYTRLDLPISDFHDWTMKAAQAAVAIRKLAPDHYWEYVDYMFANQPSITPANVDEVIRDFVTGVGVDWGKFVRESESKAVRNALNEQVGRFYSNGIFATPTFLVNGRSIFYGSGGEAFEAYLKSILGD